MSVADDYPGVAVLVDAAKKLMAREGWTTPETVRMFDEIETLRERTAIAEADADRLAEALEVAADFIVAHPFQQRNAATLLAAHREAIATRPA